MSAGRLSAAESAWLVSVAINNGRRTAARWADHYETCAALERAGMLRIAADNRLWMTDKGREWFRAWENGQ